MRVPEIATGIITGKAKFLTLEPLWRRLSKAGLGDPVFQSFDWTKDWIDIFLCNNDKLKTVIVKRQEKPVGIIPFILDPRKRILTLACSGFVDYSGFVLPSSPQIMQELIKTLLSIKGWDMLELKSFPFFDPAAGLIYESAEKNGLGILEYPDNICPFIRLWGTYDEYMKKNFSSNFRNRIRRMEKRLKKLGNHRYEIFEDGKNLDRILEKIFLVEKKSWKGRQKSGIFSTYKKRRFYFNIIKNMAIEKKLLIHLQWLEDILISYRIGFKANRKYYDYNLAFDPDFSKYSPGLLSLNNLLQYLYENEFKIFDFLKGGEKYKRMWTDNASKTIHFYIFRPCAGGKIENLTRKTRLFLKKIKKQIINNNTMPQFHIQTRN